MATVTGVTKQRADAIEAASVVGASIQGNDLVLVTHGGTQINVGRIIPPLVNSYPVGTIYFTDRPANPSTYMGGGTWVRWGKGRVPVGLDEADPQFDTVEETGGAKTHTLSVAEMPYHSHSQDPHTHGVRNSNASAPPGSAVVGTDAAVVSAGHDFYVAMGYTGGLSIDAAQPGIYGTGGGAAHNNLQPYTTCYIWKRTA